MSWLKKALFAGALGALALLGPACMGHARASVGTGGGGLPRCELLHADSQAENHPTSITPAKPGSDAEGSAICQ